MSDPNATPGMNLGDALRALPLAAPGRDAWPALAAQLAPTVPRRRRYAMPLAVAAACVLAIVAALSLRHAQRAVTAPQIVATDAPAATSSRANGANPTDATMMTKATNVHAEENARGQLAATQARSQALERWLRDTRHAASPLSSQDLAAAAEIENLIGLIDVELAASAPAGALPLWHRRVALLEDLTALRYCNDRLAETAATTTTPDALNRIN